MKERQSWLMRSIRAEYYTNLSVGVFISMLAGALIYTASN